MSLKTSPGCRIPDTGWRNCGALPASPIEQTVLTCPTRLLCRIRLVVFSGKTILVVDDEVVILRLVRESLTALLECEVDTTPNPEYAFELMLRKNYDLLIFDFSMPGIDGAILYSLITKVYEINPPQGQPNSPPPLILMSGHASQKRAQDLLREPGVRGLLAKPFSIEKLD